jgi:hypothetical protein
MSRSEATHRTNTNHDALGVSYSAHCCHDSAPGSIFDELVIQLCRGLRIQSDSTNAIFSVLGYPLQNAIANIKRPSKAGIWHTTGRAVSATMSPTAAHFACNELATADVGRAQKRPLFRGHPRMTGALSPWRWSLQPSASGDWGIRQ